MRSGDDPALHSSQNEQDTRFFAVHSKLPLWTLVASEPMTWHGMPRNQRKNTLPIILSAYYAGLRMEKPE